MSFATKNSQNRSHEWNLGAAKVRQSDSFAKINPKTANFGPKVVYLVIFRKMSWLTLAHGVWWLLLPKVVKTDPKSEIWVRQNLGSNSNSSAIIGPKTANFGPKVVFFGHFWPNIGLPGPFGTMPNQERENWLVSLWWSTKILPSDCHNCDSWPKDSRFCLKIAIFGLSGPLLALRADLLPFLS